MTRHADKVAEKFVQCPLVCFPLPRRSQYRDLNKGKHMAQKVITQLVDDMDGKELKDGEGETVSFALDGKSYELDLSKKNADKFRGLFQDYIAAGRKVTGKPGRSSRSTASGPSASEIREWAKQNGHEVPERGRIPQSVRDAFDAK